MIAMPMDAGRRHEAGQAVEELEGWEAKHLATVHIGLGEPIHQASLRRGERLEIGGGVKPFQGERPARAVPKEPPNEPLETRSVLAFKAAGLVKPNSPLNVAGDHTVESERMVVAVGVERTPETLREGDGSELRVAHRRRRTRTRVTKSGPERLEEDAEHGTRYLGRLVQEGPKPLGHG